MSYVQTERGRTAHPAAVKAVKIEFYLGELRRLPATRMAGLSYAARKRQEEINRERVNHLRRELAALGVRGLL